MNLGVSGTCARSSRSPPKRGRRRAGAGRAAGRVAGVGRAAHPARGAVGRGRRDHQGARARLDPPAAAWPRSEFRRDSTARRAGRSRERPHPELGQNDVTDGATSRINFRAPMLPRPVSKPGSTRPTSRRAGQGSSGRRRVITAAGRDGGRWCTRYDRGGTSPDARPAELGSQPPDAEDHRCDGEQTADRQQRDRGARGHQDP